MEQSELSTKKEEIYIWCVAEEETEKKKWKTKDSSGILSSAFTALRVFAIARSSFFLSFAPLEWSLGDARETVQCRGRNKYIAIVLTMSYFCCLLTIFSLYIKYFDVFKMVARGRGLFLYVIYLPFSRRLTSFLLSSWIMEITGWLGIRICRLPCLNVWKYVQINVYVYILCVELIVVLQSNCQQNQIEIYSIWIGSEFVKKISFHVF